MECNRFNFTVSMFYSPRTLRKLVNRTAILSAQSRLIACLPRLNSPATTASLSTPSPIRAPDCALPATQNEPEYKHIQPILQEPEWHQTQFIDKPLRILQWNTGGLSLKTTALWMTMMQRQIDVMMLQEISTRYNPNLAPIPFSGYDQIQDKYHKTGIYIRETLKYIKMKIKLIPGRTVEDTLYATAIVVRTQVGPHSKHILLMNVYRSPSGKQDISTALQSYVDQCYQQCSELPIPINIEGELIGGDFNASHTAWGAQRDTANSAKYGKILHDHISLSNYEVLNNDQPTRFRFNHTKKCVVHSWLDVTFATSYVKDHSKWVTLETDQQSDHYQIVIELTNHKGTNRKRSDSEIEYRWSITDDDAHWTAYQSALSTKWESVADQLEQIENADYTQDNSENISSLIQNVFCSPAKQVFELRERQTIWKKWVSSKAQAISIAYHRQYRRFMRKRHRTPNDWQKLVAKRRLRDKVMRQLKREWIEKRFHRHGLQGRDGWQIAAEVRDLNEHRGRALPDIHERTDSGHAGKVIASTTKEKVEYLNEHYHRFDNLHSSANTSWCWTQHRIIPTRNYDGVQRHKPKSPDTSPQPIDRPNHWQPRNRRIGADLNPRTEVLHNEFARRIMSNTHRRWKRAKGKHAQHLATLNSPITKMEVRRALSSFQNGKAAGPDGIEIAFLKKGGTTAVEILHRIYKLFYTKWRCFPELFKKRWIIPVIKAGKKGNVAKELRPVSLTSYIAKIWEKIVVYRLVRYLVRLQLLSRVHFAYLSSRSATDAVVYLVNRFTRNFKLKKDTHGIFFDMTSAFDTVRVPLLLWKMEHEFFIHGVFLDCLTNFLHDRYGAVKINGILSSWRADVIGVPQGGGLSPIIFLIYVDQIELADGIQGIRMSIFSDDLCISTYKCGDIRPEVALQEGLLYVQWYCYLHGLQLNLSKSYYKVFSRKHQPDAPLDIRFSGRLYDFLANDCTVPEQYTSTDSCLTVCNDTAVRYLGIWLDTKLDFREHAERAEKRIHAVYHSISRNLHYIWTIKADIAWHILDACIFSIFDFAAVFWTRFAFSAKERWRKLHSKLLRRVFNATKGTNSIHVQHQCCTLPLDHRMARITSQYFSRMIRAPRSSALHLEIKQYYWPIIKQWSCNRSAPILEPMQDRLPCLEDGKWHLPEAAEGTLIWNIIRNASDFHNDDLSHCCWLTSYSEIPSEVSFAMDLTHEWQSHQYDEEPFTDEWSETHQTSFEGESLYLFTDGSVKGKIKEGRNGGFGVHAITSQYYNTLRFQCGVLNTTYSELLDHSRLPFSDTDIGVSHRCSIDFMEALAIRRALELTVTYFRDQATKRKTWKRGQGIPLKVREALNINEIRVISDSLVVLKWIDGIYRIRNPRMLDIIQDIHWLTKTLQDENDNIPIRFQWTKSHDIIDGRPVTWGNHHVDGLAGQAVDEIMHKDNWNKFNNYWTWYNLRAAVNYSGKVFNNLQQDELIYQIERSHFGEIIQYKVQRDHREPYGKDPGEPGIEWNKYHYRELSQFSRNQIRLLLGMRTGHNNMRYYMAQQLGIDTDMLCKCGRHRHCLWDVMRICRMEGTQDALNKLRHKARILILKDQRLYAAAQADPDRKKKGGTKPKGIDHFDFENPVEYLYPKGHYHADTIFGLKKAILCFYKYILHHT